MNTSSSTHRPFLVHLIRHAESTSNADGNIIGDRSAGLSERGLEQIEALNRYLLEHPLHADALHCSTLRRALATFEGIRARLSHSKPTRKQPDSRLREIDRGDWDGLPRDQIYTPDEKRLMDLLDMDHRAPNGESMSDVAQRMRAWLYDATQEAHDNNWSAIVAVSHGIAIKCLLQRLHRMDPKTTWMHAVDNTSITTIELVGENWRLIRFNATPHLSPEW
jgi:broad specificity phosphatase PhoE